MRVVLDTNVLISGTYWSGSSFQVLKLAIYGEFSLVISDKILDEYKRVLYSDEILKKTDSIQQARSAATEKLLANSISVIPSKSCRAVADDPDDDKFVECAVEGVCEFLISQDEHLLNLKKYNGIKIVSPDEFLRDWNEKNKS